ncbi:agamous-like MADS-box protein AGL62 [Senna tora]|uniref:Agamous-like MADS-box protein AGL62 n=1 Tax=Senna tora TaxID=362788 RepID=A0A835CHU0_9FABA|nr:agamous-like MADS-box protein AGL62 [Senna tora]
MESKGNKLITQVPNRQRMKRKTEIKRLESKSKLQVTFSKRKLGLFRKAAELSLLCDSQTAVVVFSQNGKIFSSGHPDPDSVFSRYLSRASSPSSDPSEAESTTAAAAPVIRQYEEAMKELEEEKEKTLDAMVDVLASAACGNGFWWNRSVEEMDLEDALEFKKCAQELRRNLLAETEKKKKAAAAGDHD